VLYTTGLQVLFATGSLGVRRFRLKVLYSTFLQVLFATGALGVRRFPLKVLYTTDLKVPFATGCSCLKGFPNGSSRALQSKTGPYSTKNGTMPRLLVKSKKR